MQNNGNNTPKRTNIEFHNLSVSVSVRIERNANDLSQNHQSFVPEIVNISLLHNSATHYFRFMENGKTAI